LVTLAYGGPHGNAILRLAQDRPGEHEQVVELELARPSPLVRDLDSEPGQLLGDSFEARLLDGVAQRVAHTLERPHAVADGLDFDVGPAALAPDAGREAWRPTKNFEPS